MITYEGELYIRPAQRGATLFDLQDQPDLVDWLAEQLGVPTAPYSGSGASIRVRLMVERLPDKAVAP